jgi:hypothetical protein
MARPKRTDDTQIVPTPTAPKAVTMNKWRQKSSSRFDTYDEARKFFDALPSFKETTDGKKRIKRRVNKEEGHEYFDVVVYELTPKKKAPEPEVEEAA